MTEARNKARLDDLMLGNGYIPYHPALDTGIDMIYYHEPNDEILKVQLKSRPSLYKKYFWRRIRVAFPDQGDWYLYDHDALAEVALGAHIAIDSDSWASKGRWSWSTMPNWLREWLTVYRL